MHEHGTRRLQHLQALYQAPSLSSSQYTDWSKVRLQRMLVDYLVRQGRPDTARFLAKKKNIEPLVDLDLFNRCQAIRASLLRRSTTECLTWCHENKLGARKKEVSPRSPHPVPAPHTSDPLPPFQIDLEFELRLQQYIELARTRDRLKLLEARQHAQTHLFPHSAEQPWRLHSAAGLLAFPPNTTCEPARGLYAPARWEFLADLFERTHHALYAVPAAPALRLALTAGLSAVKTPMCHAVRTGSGGGGSAGGSGGREPSAHSGMGSNDVCPVCSAELNGLARDVPYANHTTSKNMETESVFLPNGRVYGLERLLAIGRKFGVAEGRVRDPTTGEIFDLAEMRTVFIS